MNVLVVVANPANAAVIASWTRMIAESGDRLEFICLDTLASDSTQESLRAALTSSEIESTVITSVVNSAPLSEILEQCREFGPELLITGQFSLPTFGDRPQTSDELLRAAPCMAVCPMGGELHANEVRNILMIANQGAHDVAALRTTEKLRQKLNARVTLATVEDRTGEKAKRAIESLIHNMGLDGQPIATKVTVDRLRRRGMAKALADQELIVCGIDGLKDIESLRLSKTSKMVLIVKRAPPIRLKAIVDWLPKINPRDHADLLQDLHQGSQWNNDFVSMLALASAIAALGLLQNSPAVVIGSMLLAPLMTPMIGAGLAIAQANIALAKQCMFTIIKGLLLAFSVSLIVGLVTPSRETLSPEILSRGTPNVLDLLIALCAAVAATIAMARPNISGGIAGVAIATALVPPICAAGVSIASAHFSNAVGALALFSTNLVAIIVASSFTFSLLGILNVSSLPTSRRISKAIKWGLVAILAVLAGPLSFSLFVQLGEGRPQTAVYPVTRAVSRALLARVAQDEGIDITFMGRSSVTNGVILHIAADREVPRDYAHDLRKIIRKKMGKQDLPVYIVCLHGQWLSAPDDN